MIVFDTKKTISRSVNIDNANIGYCIILTKFLKKKNEKGVTGMSAQCQRFAFCRRSAIVVFIVILLFIIL